jgi:hypothetical protein
MQVFFCSPSTKPLSFRSPVETDYGGSHLRAMVFDSLSEREVDMKLIRGDTKDGENWVLNDTSNRLMDWQKSEALEHWRCTCLLWFSTFIILNQTFSDAEFLSGGALGDVLRVA